MCKQIGYKWRCSGGSAEVALPDQGFALLFRAERIDHPGRHVVDAEVCGCGHTALGKRFEYNGGVLARHSCATDLTTYI